MKNHELLDLLGEVSEDYVRAAGENVVRPKFRWKAIAASAACAALVLGAALVPGLTMEGPAPEGTQDPAGTLVQRSGLHSYVLFEEARSIMTTEGDFKFPAGGGAIDVPGQNAPDEPMPDPSQPPRGDGPDGPVYADAPSAEEASAQYDRLLQRMGGVGGREPDTYPDWFGGAWLDSDWPDRVSRLTVAIVDQFRTRSLEEDIKSWCGGTGDVLFTGAKYSQNHLNGLMDGISRVFEEQNVSISSAYGVYVMDNCLGLDFYGAAPADETLAALAGLDPEGDAIRIQVFHDRSIQLTGEWGKGPAPGPAEPEARLTPATTADGEPVATPVDGSDPACHGADALPGGAVIPGGARPADGLPEGGEEGSQRAHYDLLPLDG